MPLKVIGAGQGRTGSLSLKTALEILGFGPSYHMKEMAQKNHAAAWLSVLYGPQPYDRAAIDRILEPYGSGSDHPVSLLFRELREMYPDAKVILTIRDADSWYTSCMNSIHSMTYDWGIKIVSMVIPPIAQFNRIAKHYFEVAPFTDFTNKELTIAQFHAANQQVVDSVPRDQLLIYDAKQGWAPLCEFLGVPIPEVPFPHENSTAVFQKNKQVVRVMAVTILVGVAAVGVGLWRYFC
eukprot:m.78952 g.78952  ORF g.78952 m.78952 type:complete len:238 (+) comp50609_c0_seq1:90-803(+)